MIMRCYCPKPKAILSSAVIAIVIALVLLTVHQVFLPIAGWFFPSLTTYLYDIAVYGAAPYESYKSFGLSSPLSNQIAWDDACADGLLLLAPFGSSVKDEGPVIQDPQGNLIWMSSPSDTVMNLKVQKYRDESYLTFWLGHKVGGVGRGDYVMLNSSYEVAYTVSVDTPDLYGDLHEFIITDDDTALVTIYSEKLVDLHQMHRPSRGWITDSVFQELDIATGQVLFEWHASEHLDPATTSEYINPLGGFSRNHPYDFFHINSIQKDRDGNYLISSRHLHAIMTVSGSTGEVLWIMGGALNQFTDLSHGAATNFAWQHDARWADEEGGLLSVFDNESAGPIMRSSSKSRGLLVQVDTVLMTVKLVQEYFAQNSVLSASQGSVQILDRDESDPHVLVGWGSSAVYTEFTLGGEVLCEAHFAASALFGFERVKSYRVIKTYDWVGRPSTPPDVVMDTRKIYVSWNGATEVRAWQLEGREGSEWRTLDVQEKVGFETAFSLPEQVFDKYRMAALDSQGNVLGYGEEIRELQSRSSSIMIWLFAVCAVFGIGLGIRVFRSGAGWSRWRTWVEWVHERARRPRYQRLTGMELT